MHARSRSRTDHPTVGRSLRLRALLSPPEFSLILPQEFTPDVPHTQLPPAIFERCIEEMRRCDAALLLLDAFGIDCAFEVGFLKALDRPVIGVAAASTRFLQNWMIKGGLSAVLCQTPELYAAVASDPIAGERAVEINGWQGLAAALRRVVPCGDDRPGS